MGDLGDPLRTPWDPFVDLFGQPCGAWRGMFLRGIGMTFSYRAFGDVARQVVGGLVWVGVGACVVESRLRNIIRFKAGVGKFQ